MKLKTLLLFQLFLLVFALYSLVTFSGNQRYLVPLACLVSMLIVGKIEVGVKERSAQKEQIGEEGEKDKTKSIKESLDCLIKSKNVLLLTDAIHHLVKDLGLSVSPSPEFPAIDRLAAERLRQSGEPSVLREQGPDPHDKLTTQMIFDAARGGDILAHGLVRQAGEILGVGIANIVSLVNPEIVILGGGVGIQADLLMDPIRQVVLHNAQPTSAQAVQILPAKLGAKAGLLGAAKAILLCQERCGEQ